MKNLTVNVGPMFSGKTTALQQQGIKHMKAKHKTIFLKPFFDNRYSDGYIVSHDGFKVPAINIDDTLLLPQVLESDVILIDEIQFLPELIIKDLWKLINLGKTIYCSGLDMDYKGNGFDTTMKTMAMADQVNKFTAICKVCGKDATMSCKKDENGQRVELGHEDIYFPTCKECFIKERKSD